MRDEEKGSVTLVLQKSAYRGKAKPNTETISGGKVSEEEKSDLRVAADSKPQTVAGSIAGKVRNREPVTAVAIGPNPVYVMVRAITFARRYLAEDGFDISFRPEFVHIAMENEERSGIRFTILQQEL